MEAVEIKKIDKAVAAGYAEQIVSKMLNVKVISVKYMGGGSFGMAYKVVIDKEPNIVVAKIYKVSRLHIVEAFDLNLLSEHTKMKYPKVYFTFDATPDIPVDCMCMEFVKGVDAFTHFSLLLKSKKKKRAFAEKVIESMLEIHSFTSEKFGAVENPLYDSWLAYYKPFATDVLETAKKLCNEGKLDRYIIDAMERAYNQFDYIFSEEVKSGSLTHGDLNVMNIMVNKKTLEPLAIIDPLESKFADREYDLFQLNNLTGKLFGLYNIYKEKYPVSEKCDIKSAFYGLYNEVYVYIKAGTLVKFIMNPLVKDMNKQLDLSCCP